MFTSRRPRRWLLGTLVVLDDEDAAVWADPPRRVWVVRLDVRCPPGMRTEPVMSPTERLAVEHHGLAGWIGASGGGPAIGLAMVGVAAVGRSRRAWKCRDRMQSADGLLLAAPEAVAARVEVHDRAVCRVGEDAPQRRRRGLKRQPPCLVWEQRVADAWATIDVRSEAECLAR